MGGHNLLLVGLRLVELLHAMGEVAVGDVGAGPGPELATELGLEEHLAMARDLLVLLPPPPSLLPSPSRAFSPGGCCSLPVREEGFRSS